MENNRFHYWAALATTSVVSLASLTSSFGGDWSREQKWAVSVAAISMIVAAFSMFLSLFMGEMFTSTEKHFECVVALIVLVMWCAGLPNIHEHGMMLAVDDIGNIWNVNLFFASWASFVISLWLVNQRFSKWRNDNPSTFTNYWLGFGTASLIAMTNAVTFWKDFSCKSADANSVCRRDLFAFVLAAVSGFFGLVFFAFNYEPLERACSVVLMVAWCFGIAYVVFDEGPATNVGTFYFSVWFAFFFAFWMAMSSIFTTVTEMKNEDGNETTEQNTPVEGEGKGAEVATGKNDEEDVEKEETAE